MSTFDRQNLKKAPRLFVRVSEHAMIRFRERVEEEFLHRSDGDLADLLNERIRAAVFSREVVDPREPSTPTVLHLFESRTGARLVAVVREKCVVTVLDDWMARNNYPGWEEGSTQLPPAATLASPLGDKIRALKIVPAGAPSPEQRAAETMAAQPDMYEVLAVECRALGQKLRALREHRSTVDAEIEAMRKEYDQKCEHRSAVDAEIEAMRKDYDQKRERLLALMDEGQVP